MRKRGREGKGGGEKEKRGREEGWEGVERGVAGLLAVSQSVGAAAGTWQRRLRLYYRT